MPYIKIWEKDNTGLEASANETVVFVPGKITLDSSDDSNVDFNGCLLIKPAAGDNILANIPEKIESNKYIQTLISSGLEVLYKGFDSSIAADSSLNIDFLQDKNAYDIKFLTAGGSQIIDILDDSDINTSLLTSLTRIAAKRGDCAVIGALSLRDIDTPVKAIKDNLNSIELDDSKENDISSFASIFVANMVENDSSEDSSDVIMPYAVNSYPDLAYLQSYAEAIKNNNTWESLANTARGLAPKFNKNSVISKYDLDNAMDTEGRSFNGIINLRPTNQPVIWGDRTLLKNDSKVVDGEAILNLKATSFLSIRNMISDIAKRAYNSAISNTFETNNDITWTNFKGNITQLLDTMVADYKIANYRIIKKSSKNRAEIKCEIHVSPYEPVEDFDIGIIINNTSAETTVE